MSRQARSLLAMGTALALLAGAAWVLGRAPSVPPTTPVEEKPTGYAVQEGVASVRITTGEAGYEISALGVSGIPEPLADKDRIRETLVRANSIGSLALVEERPADLAAYGLAQPSARAVLKYPDGGEVALALGNPEPVGKGRYCALEGKGAVYLLGPETSEAFALRAEDYLSLQITPPLRAVSPLSAVLNAGFYGRQGDVVIRSCADPDEQTRRDALSFGAVTHLVQGPGVVHELDRTYATEIFSSLFNLTATRVEAYGLSWEEVANRGFSDPDFTVRFMMRNGDAADTRKEDWEIRALLQQDGTALLAVGGRGAIYRAPAPAFLSAEYSSFVLRQYVSPLLADVSELKVFTGGKETIFRIGGTPAQPEVRAGDAVVDTALFRRFYTLAVSAASDGEPMALREVGGDPALAIEYVYKDPLKPPDRLDFFTQEARKLVVSVNGTAESAMRGSFGQALDNALTALLEGRDFGQSW